MGGVQNVVLKGGQVEAVEVGHFDHERRLRRGNEDRLMRRLGLILPRRSHLRLLLSVYSTIVLIVSHCDGWCVVCSSSLSSARAVGLDSAVVEWKSICAQFSGKASMGLLSFSEQEMGYWGRACRS